MLFVLYGLDAFAKLTDATVLKVYEGHSVNNESDHGMGCMSDSIEG